MNCRNSLAAPAPATRRARPLAEREPAGPGRPLKDAQAEAEPTPEEEKPASKLKRKPGKK